MAVGEYVFGTAIRHYTILNGAKTRTHGTFETEDLARAALDSKDVQSMVGDGATVIGNSTLRQEGQRGRKAGTKNAPKADANGTPAAPAQVTTSATGSKPGVKVS